MKPFVTASGMLLLSVCIAFGSELRTFDRNLSVTGEVDLDVSSGPGGVVITSGNVASVQVHAVIRPSRGPVDLGLTEGNIQQLEQNPPVEQRGNRVRIGYVSDPAILRGVSVTYEIQTPRQTRVNVRTSSGRIHIEDIDGPAVVDSSSGRIEIGSVSNNITATNSSGAIVIRDASGILSARNNSGSIEVLAAGAAPLHVETGSGRILVRHVPGEVHSKTHSGSIIMHDVAGPIVASNHSGSIQISQVSPAAITARTDSGAIKVRLAERRGYSVDAQSDSGRISGPNTTGVDRIALLHRLKGQIGEGGPLVDLDTRTSKIVID